MEWMEGKGWLRQLGMWLLPVVLILLGAGPADAGPLVDRLAAFPKWETKPATLPAEGDLVYPDWMAGTWTLTSRLVDLVAPLAPEVVTPGFDSNQQYLDQPVTCQVRFVDSSRLSVGKRRLPLPIPLPWITKHEIVSDRAFNGLNLARAYLGDRNVLEVTVDPNTPNRQVTLLPEGRQLISLVTARAVETPDPDHFVTTEVFQQIFRGPSSPYLNQVETTTAYHHQVDSSAPIVADQVTAIYLSPQDPQFFTAGDRPVALYRYQLEFTPTATPAD